MPSNHAPLSQSKWAHPRPFQQGPGIQSFPSRPRYQSDQVVSMGGNSMSKFDPLASTFEPNGTEVQRYQPQGDVMTLPSSAQKNQTSMSPDMAQMQRLVMTNHFSHEKDIATLERKAENAEKEVGLIKGAVGRDMRLLQTEIENLKQEIRDKLDQNGMLGRSSQADGFGPSSIGGLGNLYKDKLAVAYLDEADDYEKAAGRLRNQAREMSSEFVEDRLVTMNLVEDPNGHTNGSGYTKAEFACCGQIFTTIDHLLGHVNTSHGNPITNNNEDRTPDQNGVDFGRGECDKTPTHIPPRRVKVANNKSVVKERPQEKAPEPSPIVDETKSNNVSRANGIATEDATTSWKPLAVRQMPEPTFVDTSASPETFSWDFLVTNLHGKQWSPGFYFVPHTQDSDLPSRSYWLLEAEYEPFLPASPGQHGAKLTAFFNSASTVAGEAPQEENYEKAPVFIRAEGQSEYVYFGNYSQLRFSDKLEYDRVMGTVPEKVRQYWADQLSDRGRPKWVTECLREHFWPMPTYTGPIPIISGSSSGVSGDGEQGESSKTAALEAKAAERAMSSYMNELREWKSQTDVRVAHLSSVALMKAFSAADADEAPGLRLWWEYLQCVEYDQGYYDFLVAIKRNPGLQTPSPAVNGSSANGKSKGGKVNGTGRKAGPNVGGKTVTPGAKGVVTLKPTQGGATPKSTARSKFKPHTQGMKPWEEDLSANEWKGASNGMKVAPNGDLDLAREMQNGFTKAKPRASGGPSNGADRGLYMAPHLRGRQAENVNTEW